MHATRFLSAAIVAALLAAAAQAGGAPLELGSRLELFVDDFLIDKLSGAAALHLHKPAPKEVVLVTDQPWEGNTCAYYTIFQDGDKYRMYFRGSHYDEKTRKAAHREVTCYAESKDGIHWMRPDLGLFEFEGTKKNNIVWDGVGTHNFTPFKDANPACPPDARYRALGSGGGKKGLYAFKSVDGIHWQLLQPEPVITVGAFDSQNLAFWDPHARLYREYHRGFQNGVRDIMTSTSKDFVVWTKPEFLKYPGAPKEHLYTNAVQPYPRAPHLLLGFPTRFLPEPKQQTEPTFMTSRDGQTFHRWAEAVIPRTAPKDRDGNRSNYMTWGLVQLPGNNKEYSVYATEAYYTGPDSRVRRFTYRVDGFVSVRAPSAGELVTRPFTFTGKKLVVNVATAKKGSVQVEIQSAAGKPLDAFHLQDCVPVTTDAIAHTVAWKQGVNLSKLAGQTVRLRFQLTNADLFSLQFAP